MRGILFIICLVSSIAGYSQNIIVNSTSAPESVLGAEDLTREVLIDGGVCSDISNFLLKDNTQQPFPNTNRSWGYFEKATSDFPFESGIVMTSGRATDAKGPNTTDLNYGGSGWGGESILNIISGNSTMNATVFEFDFVPYGNEISFNYIFASKEYEDDFGIGFECSGYNDSFAFVISGPGIVNDPGISGKNIALLPNGDPVTIDNVNGVSGCGDDTYFVHINNGSPPINYNGRTTPLTAYSQVIPGQTYRIRLMIADAVDTQYDSAVFLEAGSFSLGSTFIDINGTEIGEDELVCDQTSYSMFVDVDAPDATYQWYFEGDPIPGETNPDYTATVSGNYSVEVFAYGCSDTREVDLTFSTSPTVVPKEDFVCTETGSFVFNLSDYNEEIASTDNIFSYYNSQLGAEQEIELDEITNSANFEVLETDGLVEVYVRVQNTAGCFDVALLELEVGKEPETEPKEYTSCDDDGDGFANFDLEAFAENLVLSNPLGLEYEFYLDVDLTQLIPNPDNYDTDVNGQIIYVKIFNPTLGNRDCPVKEELTLIINELVVQPETWLICDNLNDNSEFVDLALNDILQTEGIVVTYQYFEQDGTPILDFNNYEVTASPTFITVKIENDDLSCSRNETLTIEFNQAPVLTTATLNRCSSNGFAEFNLLEANDLVIGDTTDLEFSYYLTFAEAETGDPSVALPNNYTNTTPDNQSVYVRVLDLNGCYNVEEVILDVNIGPDTIPNSKAICDDNGDGIAEFNLEVLAPEVLVNPPSGTVQIDYFLDSDLTIPVPNPASFENTNNPQIVYITFIDPALGAEACTSVGELTLIVEEFPELQPDAWSVCDNLNDNSEFVDLTQNEIVQTDEITVSYSYFEQDGTPIPNPANFEITSSPTVINVLVRNQNGTCEEYSTITIDFLAAPEAVDDPFPLVYCSLNDFANYNLTDLNEFLINENPADFNFTYHLSEENALNNEAALPENYINTEPDQTIYVRIENINGCFDIAQLILDTELIYNQLEELLEVCDDPYEVSDGIALFDLTEMQDLVENSLGGNGYTIKYYTSFEEAIGNTNAISNPSEFQNTTSPQTIFAVASDGINGCAGIVDFRINVLPVPEFELPEFVSFCNYDEKDFHFFDSFSSYTWLDADGNVVSNDSSVTFSQEGIYTLEVVSNENECAARREIEVIFDNQPNILDVQVNEHTIVVSAAGGYPPYEYSINNGLTWTDNNTINNVPGGVYELIVKSKYGCISTAKSFAVLGVPNFISPNGDGKNDYWEIRGLEAYPDARIKIFNRYGKMFMDRPISPQFRWDGTYLGNPVGSGDYWYIITLEDGKSVSGHISVISR